MTGLAVGALANWFVHLPIPLQLMPTPPRQPAPPPSPLPPPRRSYLSDLVPGVTDEEQLQELLGQLPEGVVQELQVGAVAGAG